MVSFAEATAVEALDPYHYLANFPDDWCIGSVPHGGYVTSCFLSATALHFSTTHAARNQPHTITLHLTFLRRTAVGPAQFSIRDIKIGRRTSTVHVSLTQGSDAATAEPSVVGYLTQSNLNTEEGLSLPTHWSLHPAPSPLLSTQSLHSGDNKNWALAPPLHPKFRKAANHIHFYVPRHGQLGPAMADECICFSQPGEKFKQESLGFVVDQFPQIVEIYPGNLPALATPAMGNVDTIADRRRKKETKKPNWYPTVLLNLDVKKALPEEGVEWLFVRVRAKKIENGRMDLEVVVLDEGGELVAVSNHVCLILGAERNMSRSEKGQGSKAGKGDSKL
ncbi:MAG: hypothetical protein Q9184_000057 [Pyrenodesmia sp. 2 TL-2023]